MTLTTAVEWLVEELNKSIGLTKFVDTCDNDYKQEILGIIEQAKEMEKANIIEFANDYGFEICGYDYEKAEQYYNETFK
jgi:hypothetical protein